MNLLAFHAVTSPAMPAMQDPSAPSSRRRGPGRFLSDLLDLTVFEFDRGGPAKNGNLDLEARPLFVDFLHAVAHEPQLVITQVEQLSKLLQQRLGLILTRQKPQVT